ncbi:Predicted membrane protein [Nakamurella panacisegetis]|uniref:Predicted membrane protein n=1 Tax=Nakamurella panacisegetis TaxID=1090615 RepID=A0A1H0M3N9_9ACTN|nr:DUF2079 domain-containing protein [Nakamurella panacisegetis]SDO75007.1 Predicted membrane protein [Nakamurella panacisegetis]
METPAIERVDTPDTMRSSLRWLPYVLAVLLAGAYALLSLTRFALISTPSWDNAIFEQAIRAYAHFRAPIVDIKGPGYNILGDHFSPVIALVAPFYRLFPHAQTLLVAQAVLIAASIIPVARAALRHLGPAAGCAVAVAYSISFGLQSAVYTDFHEVAFAAPLIAFAGEAFLRRRWRAVAAWSLPLLLVKEDLGVTLAAIGVVLIIVGARRLGIVLAGIGIAGTALILFVVIPAFNATGSFDYWDNVSLGGGPGMAQTFASGWDLKTVTLLLTFGITGFLALRSPWVLLALPTLAWRWVGIDSTYWGTNFHYSLILMPIVFVAMIDGIERVGRHPSERPAAAAVRRYTEHVPTLALGVALVLCLQLPLFNLFKADTYHPGPAAAAERQLTALIPKGSTVETNMGLSTHLATDYDVYWFLNIGAVVPDYVVIDLHSDNRGPDVVAWAERQHPGVTYRQIFSDAGYVAVQRVN